MDDSILSYALTGVVPATCDAEAGEFHRPVAVNLAGQASEGDLREQIGSVHLREDYWDWKPLASG